MGKGDKKSRKGKITMGSYGNSRPKKKRHNYRFVPRPKKEQLASITEALVTHEPEVDEPVTEAKPKRKTAAKKKEA